MCGKVTPVILHGIGDTIPRWDSIPRGYQEIDAINAQFAVGGRLNYLFWVSEVRL